MRLYAGANLLLFGSSSSFSSAPITSGFAGHRLGGGLFRQFLRNDALDDRFFEIAGKNLGSLGQLDIAQRIDCSSMR